MTPVPKFGDTVEKAHRRIDSTAYEKIYVVGDVHGSRAALESLLSALELGDDDVVVFVGDLVRKGPDSPGVIDIVRSDDRLLSVRGNNEAKLLRGDKDPDWLRDGDVAYLASLPMVISFDDAGYDGPFWYEDYDGPYRVFFGHTVHECPVEYEHAVGLDTGCVYGGTLTAYDYRRGAFITVDPTATHQDRSSEKIAAVP